MRQITNVKLPEASNGQDVNNLYSLVLDKNGIIICIDKVTKKGSGCDEDWYGDWLSPRAIDLQINGGLGISFTDLSFKQIPTLLKLLDRLWIDGVEGICPTFVSCSLDQLRLGMNVLNETRKYKSMNRCRLLGAHLEGPFLSESYFGAHEINSICQPSISALNQRINKSM